MIQPLLLTDLMRRVSPYLPAALIAAGLKFHYSRAEAGQLAWVLRPTAELVGRLGGQSFHFQPGAGWATSDGAFVIAPSCAGVNFLILLFALGILYFLHEFGTFRRRCLWYLGSLLGAFAATLMVNTLRILLSIELYRADIYGAWLTPERLHHMAGIAIYLGALWGLIGAQHWGILILFRRRQSQPERRISLTGSTWYVLPAYTGMTMLLPLLNGAAGRYGSRFVEHCIMVAVTCLVVTTGVFLLQKGMKNLTGGRK